MASTRQLLAASLKALFHQQGVTALQASKATGIDNATISKFQLPTSPRSRWPRADHFDALAAFFSVQPYVLLKPDEVLAGRNSDARHTAVAHQPDSAVGSPSPASVEGGSALLRHPDSELLAALLAYWDDMSPEARLELVGHGHRLRSASTAATPVGFKRA
jgi:hypothetical protein